MGISRRLVGAFARIGTILRVARARIPPGSLPVATPPVGGRPLMEDMRVAGEVIAEPPRDGHRALAGGRPPLADLTASEKIIAEKTVCVLLVRGESPEGGRIYAYVAVRADMLRDFMAAQARGIFHPEDFGIILASGPDDPPPDVRERMTREYGFNHEKMIDLPNPDRATEVLRSIDPPHA